MKLSVFKKILSFVFVILILLGAFLSQNSGTISAATTKKQTVKSTTLQSGKQFTLMNMPYNGVNSIISTYKNQDLTVRCIQNFGYTPDGKFIFTIGECNVSGEKYGMLTRCAVPSKVGENAEAPSQEVVVLEKFGHSDVIAVTQDDLSKQVYNLWVSCKPGSDGYARQIARLTYKVDKSGKGKITKTVYINGFEKTNVSGGKSGYYTNKLKAEKIHCAVDAESNQLVFRLKLEGSSCYYLSYNLKNINSALNSVKDKGTFDIGTKPKWQNARVVCNLTPLCTFQSFDVEGKSIYIIGGHFGLGAQIYAFDYETQKNGKIKEQNIKTTSDLSRIVTLDAVIKIDDADYDKNYLEVEGFKVENSGKKTYCYVSFNCSGPNMRNSVSVYKVALK